MAARNSTNIWVNLTPLADFPTSVTRTWILPVEIHAIESILTEKAENVFNECFPFAEDATMSEKTSRHFPGSVNVQPPSAIWTLRLGLTLFKPVIFLKRSGFTSSMLVILKSPGLIYPKAKFKCEMSLTGTSSGSIVPQGIDITL
jgi:hypothetical protein